MKVISLIFLYQAQGMLELFAFAYCLILKTKREALFLLLFHVLTLLSFPQYVQTFHFLLITALLSALTFLILLQDDLRLRIANRCSGLTQRILDAVKGPLKRVIHIRFISFILRHLSPLSLVLLILSTALGCSKEIKSVSYGGQFSSFIARTEKPAFNEPTVIEASVMQDGSELWAFIDPDYSGKFRLKVRNADKGDWSFREITEIGYARFHFTFQYAGAFFTVARKGPGIFLWESPDGLTWTLANSGAPVLTTDPDPASPWHQLWNVALAVDENGVAHLLAESSDQTPGQRAVGLAYATAPWNPSGMSFDAGRSPGHVLPGGGNPDLKITQSGRLLALYGKANASDSAFGDFWHVTVAFADLNADLIQAESWTERQDLLRIGSSEAHIADPHLTDLPEGGSLLTFSYDQVTSIALTLTKSVEELAEME